MASLRVAVQHRVSELIQGGTFTGIVYGGAGNIYPEEMADDLVEPKSVVVNEIAGSLTDNARTGATGVGFVLTNWRFEAVAEFTREVDVTEFLLNEFRQINFNVNNLLVAIAPSGDFRVTHPPREGSHSGTKLTVGLTVNTRR